MATRRARVCEEHHAMEMADVQVVLNQTIDTVCLTLTTVNETIEQANSRCKKTQLQIAPAQINETDAEAVLKRVITSVCIAEAHDNESQQQAECHQQDVAAHRNRNINQNAPSLNIARKGDQPQLQYVGQMNILCPHCNALKFPNENLFKCCHNGKVSLKPLKDYPDELRNLLLGNSAKATNFKENIRRYNSACAFASFGVPLEDLTGKGPPCFRICGQILHRSGSLHPAG